VYDVFGKSPAHMAEMSFKSYAILQSGRGFNKGGVKESKSPPITGNRFEDNNHLLCGNIRRLTPTECTRLQTIPEWYKWNCSEMQQYKLLGNGWTVDVIKHILGFLPQKYLTK
jgi:site-specific DNA-cytosine methylase